MAIIDPRGGAGRDKKHRRRGDDAADEPVGSLWVDALILLSLLALFASLIALGREWASPLVHYASVDLSLSALPKYTFLSLSRGFAAYLLSLLFTIIYGGAAARSRRAERILVPIIDVLQGIPVLSFLPGLVLGLLALFPNSNIGLELACVLSIFTGQVWNMTFSFYASVRSIPAEIREASRIYRFGWWRKLTVLEIPSAMIGLVWNSMMSMAGGWFFLTVVESFKLKGTEFRLAGIGSYMSAAVHAGDTRAMVGACVAMILMIVLVDQIFWRPLIAWSERFKADDTEAAEHPTSIIYDKIRRSRLAAWLRKHVRFSGKVATSAVVIDDPVKGTIGLRERAETGKKLVKLVLALLGASAAVLLCFGTYRLTLLLMRLGLSDWVDIFLALGYTSLRVLAVVAIGAVWTTPLGILIGRSPKLSRIFQPVIQVVASFPMPMIFPILAPFLVKLGLSFTVFGAALLMMVGTQWYILFNVIAGAAAVPEDLREVARVFGLSGAQRARVVFLPGVFPYLLTGLITAAGGAWNASIVSEWVAETNPLISAPGIGSMIFQASETGKDALLAASVLVLSATLVVVNRFIWKPLYRLAERRFALNR